MITTASPRAWASPADIADCWPKFRDSSMTVARESPAAIASRRESVPSRLPSSM